MARVHQRLGSCILPRHLEDLQLEDTPQYDLYEDETQNEQSFPQLAEELEPMPKMGDHYIGFEILLPRGDQMARGQISNSDYHKLQTTKDSFDSERGRYWRLPI